MNRDDFDSYKDLGQYWLREDALRSLDYDVYFSLGTRYYCDAGCKVCYIQENLKKVKPLASSFYNKDLNVYSNTWKNIFDHFGCLRTNDDLFMLKHQYPNEYKWYEEHGKYFEVCITDNAIFRLLQLDLEISVGDVSISTEFIKDVSIEKVMKAIKALHNKFTVKKIKFIDCGDPTLFEEIIKWSTELELHNCVHHDFRTDHRDILNHKWAEYQNTWVINDSKGLMQIYRESIHLYYDRFYFSSDDASDLNEEYFYTISNFNAKDLIVNMLLAKQYKYSIWADRVSEGKFKDYYNEVQTYNVNKDFNFIPAIMYPQTSRFIWKLVEDGWKMTKFGLLESIGIDNIIPLVSK